MLKLSSLNSFILIVHPFYAAFYTVNLFSFDSCFPEAVITDHPHIDQSSDMLYFASLGAIP